MNAPQPQRTRYLFLKQAALLHSYFGEICLDVPAAEEEAVVLSQIDACQIGRVCFRTGPKYKRDSFRSRLVSWIQYCVAAAGFAFGVKGRPLLFLVAQPPFLPLLGYLQKKILGRKYVVWIDDIYPDVLLRKGLVKENGWVVRLWSIFNRKTFSEASHVFTLGPYMLKTLQKYLDPGTPTTILPTWVDTDKIHPINREENSWVMQHDLTNKFTIMYSGNFGETHEVDLLVDAARQLRSEVDLCFVLIGSGKKWEMVRESVWRGEDPNILVLPWQPSERLSQSLSAADVAYVSLANGIEGISMPSKTYYAMAAGCAIVAACREKSDLGAVVKRSECGLLVRPGSLSDLIDAVLYLYKHGEETARYKRNARNAAVTFYSRKANTALLRGILQKVAEGVLS